MSCRLGARRWVKVRTSWPGASSVTGDSGGKLEDKGRVLGESLRAGTCPSSQRETRIAAAWNAWHDDGSVLLKAKVEFKCECNVFKATTQGALLSSLSAGSMPEETGKTARARST